MSFISVVAESRKPEWSGFRVPEFEIRVNGASLADPVRRDVVSVSYKDNVKQIDSVELSVNNWDATQRAFKYIGAESVQALKSANSADLMFRVFDPCNKQVEVWIGYAGAKRLMMTGSFTTMEPNFTNSGPPLLTVRGLNALHQLRRKQYSYAWTNAKPSKIAQDIQSLKDDKGQKRFPMPIEIDTNALDQEKEIDYIAQNNQYDVDFLLNLARRFGYDLFIKQTSQPKRTVLYFGPSQRARLPVDYELKWGESLVDFKPTLTTANQVKSVTVHGWNRKTKKPITVTVGLDDPKLKKLNPHLQEFLNVCDPKEEDVVDEPVFSEDEARRLAQDRLLNRFRSMVKASGTTVGLPDLRAGSRVRVLELGARLSGVYFVTETTHTIDDQGYVTRFQARMEDERTGT